MFSSLKTRLVILFTLFTFVPVVIGTAINTYFDIKEMKETAIASNLSLNKEIANEIQRLMDNAQGINNAVSVMPIVRSMNADAIKAAVIEIQEKNPQFELIAVLDAKGNQIARSSGKPGNRSDRLYFKEAIKGNVFFSDAYISATTNMLCVTVAAPVRDAGGNIVGAVASDVTLKYLWDISDGTVLGKAGYIDIVDNKGMIIAHPDKEKIKNNEDFSKYAFVSQAIQGNAGGYESDSSTGTASVVTFAPVGSYHWGVITYQPVSELYDAVIGNAIVMAIIILIFVAISILIAFRVSKSIVTPIRGLIDAANRISRGDLSSDVVVNGAEEINRLTDAFNVMVKHLRGLILKTTETSETVSASAEELAASIDMLGKSAEEIASTVKTFAETTDENVRVSELSIETINEIVEHIDTAAAAAQTTAGVSGESKVVADQGAAQSDEAIAKITNVQAGVKKSAGVITSLGEKSRRIGNIVDTITKIAGQTNLLALNAAIEAARAGEHGKGFAVVAGEVGKLAEQSETAANEIAAIINTIRDETLSAVDMMNKSCQEVDDGVASVEKTAASFRDINQSITNMNEHIQHILRLSTKQKDGSATMEKSIHDISEFLQVNVNGINRIANVSGEQSASVQEVRAAADDLARVAMDLRAEINKFSV